MIIFMRGGSPWRAQLLSAVPSALVGLGLALILRQTTLTSSARVLLATMPMMFLFALTAPYPRPISLHRRTQRAALITIGFGTAMYVIMLIP